MFFFQAEDGIRDYKVTGVQTCALPIWRRQEGACARVAGQVDRTHRIRPVPRIAGEPGEVRRREIGTWLAAGFSVRSEERRVGKEWRCRGAAVARDEREFE